MFKINCVLLLVLSLTSVIFTERPDNENEEEPFHPHRDQPESMFTSPEQEAPTEQNDERPRGITFEYAFSTSHSSPHSHKPLNFEMNDDYSDSKFPSFSRESVHMRPRGFEKQAHEFARQSLPSYSRASSPFSKDSHDFPPFPTFGPSRPLPSSSTSASPFTSSPSLSTTTPYPIEAPNLSTTPSFSHAPHTRTLSSIFLKNDELFNSLKTSKTSPSLLNYATNSRRFMRRFGYDNEEDYEEPMFNDDGDSMYDHEARISGPVSIHVNPDSKMKMVKVMMGKKNDYGKPWGSKTTVYYHDPRSPDNYMHLTEVNMNMNSRKHTAAPHHDVDFEMFNDQSKISATSIPPFMFKLDNYEPGLGDMF